MGVFRHLLPITGKPMTAACVDGGDVYINGVPQGWGNKAWQKVVVTASGDVWAICREVDGVYKNGVPQGWPNSHGNGAWTGLVADGADVYAGQNWNGDATPAYVYKNGAILSEWPGNRSWRTLAIAPNGDLWGCGDDDNSPSTTQKPFKNGTVQSAWPSASWEGLTVDAFGNAWVGLFYPLGSRDIYKNAAPQNWGALRWDELAAAPNGDVWAISRNGDVGDGVYKNGIAQTDWPHLVWSDISIALNGDVYICSNGGDVFCNASPVGWGNNAWSSVAVQT